MNTEGLLDYLNSECVADGSYTHDEMRDWIRDHAWELLMAAYPGSRELNEEVSDITADYIMDDLVFNMDGAGLIETYIWENIPMMDDEE